MSILGVHEFSKKPPFCILRFPYLSFYLVETSRGLYRLHKIYRKCLLNRREDKKVLHRRSYIKLGHILHARAHARAWAQVQAQKHTTCAPATWKCRSYRSLLTFVNRIVEVTLLRAGCVCRLIFWVALHARAVTGNRARRCGKFSPDQILVCLESHVYIFDIVFSTSHLGDAQFLRTELFTRESKRGRARISGANSLKHAINWITLRSNYRSEVSDSMTSF